MNVQLSPPPVFSRDFAFVIPRRFDTPHGLALATEIKDADSIVDRGGRHLFVVPWRDYSLIGVWHKIFDGPSEELRVTEEELTGYMNEVNQAYPSLISSLDQIKMINMGLTLFGEEQRQGARKISFGKRSQIIDHRLMHGVEGLLTLIGVRATTARGMAAQAIDIIGNQLSRKIRNTDSASEPLYGGKIDDFDILIRTVRAKYKERITSEQAAALVRNYGSEYHSVLKYAQKNPTLLETLPGSAVLKGEVIHAVREEMAQKLSDVVFRRTDLGTGEPPNLKVLNICASLMKSELGWDVERCQQEIEEAQKSYWRSHV